MLTKQGENSFLQHYSLICNDKKLCNSFQSDIYIYIYLYVKDIQINRYIDIDRQIQKYGVYIYI